MKGVAYGSDGGGLNAAKGSGESLEVTGVVDRSRGWRGRCSWGRSWGRGGSSRGGVASGAEWASLVVKCLDGGKVGGDPENSVEGVSLDTSLCGFSTRSSCDSGSASSPCCLVGAAEVDQLIAHETSDDVDVLSRAVVEVGCEYIEREVRAAGK